VLDRPSRPRRSVLHGSSGPLAGVRLRLAAFHGLQCLPLATHAGGHGGIRRSGQPAARNVVTFVLESFKIGRVPQLPDRVAVSGVNRLLVGGNGAPSSRPALVVFPGSAVGATRNRQQVGDLFGFSKSRVRTPSTPAEILEESGYLRLRILPPGQPVEGCSATTVLRDALNKLASSVGGFRGHVQRQVRPRTHPHSRNRR